MMPRMDGIAFLRALRAEPRTSTIPVVLLSARAGEEAIVGGLETGADDYLVKPFSARELLSRVGTHLEMARVRRAATDVANELAEMRAALLKDVERKNQELESFSYSVSHDLRAPLRAIDGYSQILLEDFADALDDDGKKYLRYVREATQHMAQLIDDLLSLARVTRTEIHRVDVDLTALARRISERLRAASPERDGHFIIKDGMRGNADSRLLAVLLENLLGNAWKFTSKRKEAEITFGCEERDGKPTYFVKDNGAGFDMAYTAKLFGAFQRLHATSEFEGTGIGLATVQRVLHRHDGDVWAEGKVDGGATFYFTLGGGRKP